ncbi:unnamed protein product [Urochloa humidicola]
MTKDDELVLSYDDIERFEQFADSAQNILRRVESGCSLRRYMFFPCPFVRHLFDERRTLKYRTVQAEHERCLYVRPICLKEERGVEASVEYSYTDRKRPEKSFLLELVLRFSESTDIVGVAMNCLQSLASQFNLVADTAMGELTLLANLQDVSQSHEPPWVGIQEWHSQIIRMCRPDPFCCKAKGHVPCANDDAISSELSHAFPEEVMYFTFNCYISSPEYSLHSSTDGSSKRNVMTNRNRRPNLLLAVSATPHHVHDERLRASYAVETIGDNGEERIDVTSIQQVTETARSRAINCFLRQPEVTEYIIGWATKHGAIGFLVEKPNAGGLKTSGRRFRSSRSARHGVV